jgi:L,D-peptidoglycan transpeptidase YkuD (ErfK/YbiS/YcfS/YnhG family)
VSVVAAVAAVLACAAPVASPGAATQLVTVTASTHVTTFATVRLWARSGGCWRPVAGPWRARVGRNGLSTRHREGDGTTPVGSFAVGRTVYGVAANPGVRLAYHRLVCGDWWDEDPSSPTYNTFRHVRCGARPPFRGGSEALWTYATAYRHFAVIEYNARPPVPGRGSAIFLHADTGRATNGCVSLPLAQLERTLRWLRAGAQPRIAIGTGAELRRL